MTNDEADGLQLAVLYAVAEIALPEIRLWYARDPAGGPVLGTVLYGGLGALVVAAVKRNTGLDGVLAVVNALVEYGTLELENSFERWAPRLHEFFEALAEDPAANAAYARLASERVRAGAARLGFTWSPEP